MAECLLLKPGGGTKSDDCTATKADVLVGVTAVTKDSGDEAVIGTMANKGSWTSRIGINGKAVIPAGYHNGSGYVDQSITNRGAISASLGINGTYTIPEGYHNGAGKVTQSIATMGAQSIKPGTTAKTVSCSGKYMTGNITVPALNIPASYIKKGQVITFPDGSKVTGTFEGWVPVATDLYYNGQNPAGFTLGSGFVFENTQIKMKSLYSQQINFTKTYNVQSYSKLVFEGNFVIATNGRIRLEDSTGRTLAEIYVTSSTALSSLQLNISQTISIPNNSRIDFCGDAYAATYIKRIRLA